MESAKNIPLNEAYTVAFGNHVAHMNILSLLVNDLLICITPKVTISLIITPTMMQVTEYPTVIGEIFLNTSPAPVTENKKV
jgi:hypothetical protein